MARRAMMVGVASVAIAAVLALVTVSARSTEPVTATTAAVPRAEIVDRAQDMGLQAVGQPVRNGAYYVLHAQNARGRDMRVVADAEQGEILWLAPVSAFDAYASQGMPRAMAPRYEMPRYDRSPRILHVPQANDANASLPDDVEQRVAPQPRRVTPAQPKKTTTDAPRRKPYSANASAVAPATAPPPVERRAVITAPIHDGPTPIRPTPRYAKQVGEKFPPTPPPGYRPPSNLPPQGPVADETSLPADMPADEQTTPR